MEITTKDKIRAVARLYGCEDINDFILCICYFLVPLGYKISKTPMNNYIFSTCTALTKIRLPSTEEVSCLEYFVLTPESKDLPLIEVIGCDENDMDIFVNKIKFSFDGFMHWYKTQFGVMI